MSFTLQKLNMKVYIPFLLLIISPNLFGQIRVLDAESKQELPFVYILDKQGNYVASTSEDGIIIGFETSKLSTRDSLTLYHISYKPLTLSVESVVSSDTIFLKLKDHALNEIVVKARKGKDGYLKLNGAFRSYQFYDGELKFYADGQVDYCGKVKNQKFKNKVNAYRYYENDYLLDEDKGNRINWSKVGVTKIENDFLPFEVFDHSNPIIKSSNDSIQLILIHNDTVGRIISKRGYLILELKDFFSKTRISLFGNTSILRYRYITLIFKDLGQSIVDIDSYENLLYYKVISAHDFYRKGADDSVSIVEMKEFFVDESEYYRSIGEIERFEDYSKYYTLYESGNFSNDAEYITQSRFYYPLPKTILAKTGFER